MTIHFTSYLGGDSCSLSLPMFTCTIHVKGDGYSCDLLRKRQSFISISIQEEMSTQFKTYSGTDDHAFQYIFRRRELIISIPIQEKVVIHFSAYLKGTNIHFNIYLEGDIHTFQYKWRRIPFILVPIYKEVAIHFNIHLVGDCNSFQYKVVGRWLFISILL